jgi:hypothetical protein
MGFLKWVNVRYTICSQCCRTKAGTGTEAFCLSGMGAVMHSSSRYGSGFGPGSNIKSNTKVKSQKLEANFLGKNSTSSSEKARFCTIFLLLKNCAKYV